MAYSKKVVAGGGIVLAALLAMACGGQPSQDQNAAPAQTTQAPADQAAPAAPADQGAAPAAAPAEGTAPAPAQSPEQPHN